MKRTLYLAFLLMLCRHIVAIPAYPYKIAVSVNGKEYYIRLFGDEHSKRAETEDGYTIMQNEKHQWCYAVKKTEDELVPSCWKLGSNKESNHDFQAFLSATPKHLSFAQVEKRAPEQNTTKEVKGRRKVLIILMEYKDLAFSKAKDDYDRLFNEEGYSDDNAQGSVRDFYLAASYHQLELVCDIYGPYTTQQNMSYYGGNTSSSQGKDANAYYLFVEAITNAAREADLSEYDGDGDGFIDNVHIIFAGYGEEAGAVSDAIWSHEANFRRPYEINGMKIDKYSCAPELRGNSGGGISRIGPHCHEIGHALGAMDFYDTDYADGGNYEGTGDWDVMASGSWNNEGISPADFNPYVKAYNYGWVVPQSLPIGNVEINPSYLSSDNYFLLKSSEYGDYYLLENRSRKGWGIGLPGEGLLIFHIHSDIMNAGNSINASAPQMCYVVCASSRSNLPNSNPSSYGNINSSGCPYPGTSNNHNFGQTSTPTAFYWDDTNCGIEVTGIELRNDGVITLNNNSTGSDYTPMSMVNLFFEGFEGDSQIHFDEQNNLYRVVENPDNLQEYIDKPVAFEGTRCLQLSARGKSQDAVSAFEFECLPNNSEGAIRINVCVSSLALRFNKPNILKVGYQEENSDNWLYRVIESSENNKWHQSVIDIPLNAKNRYRIEGTAFAGSILAVDNISVEQQVLDSDTGISSSNSKELNHIVGVYSVIGRKQQDLRPGLNIVRMSDGTSKKIMIQH